MDVPGVKLAGNGPFDQSGQLVGADQRLPAPKIHHRRRNPPGLPLLPEVIKNIGQILFRQLVEQVGRGRSPARVHPHVQRSAGAEAEAPGRGIQLQGGNPKVEQDPIHRCDPQFAQGFSHGGKIPMADGQPFAEWGQPLPGQSQGLSVTIEAQHPAIRTAAPQDLAAMAAQAEVAVQIQAPRFRPQQLHGLPQQDRNVGHLHLPPFSHYAKVQRSPGKHSTRELPNCWRLQAFSE